MWKKINIFVILGLAAAMVSPAIAQTSCAGFPSCTVRIGTNGPDYIAGNSGSDCIFGRGGDDALVGNGGRDCVHGEDGSDYVRGGTGDDDLYGEDDVDYIHGNAGDDRMWGGDGDVNGSVSAFDFLNTWLPINGGPLGYDAGDFDMNGSGTAFDFLTVWLPANGQASQVP